MRKVVEEAEEVLSASLEKVIIELADLYEVIDAVMVAYGIDKQAVLDVQARVEKSVGALNNGSN